MFDIKNIAFQVLSYPLSYVELIGTSFGLLSVYYASKANILTWSTGIFNEIFLFMLFFQVQLYADMFLQIYFFFISVYGWYNWKQKSLPKPITQLSLNTSILLLIILLMGSLLAGYLFQHIHSFLPSYFPIPAAYPYADSFIITASIIATILLAKKKIENWYLWIIINVVCIILYYKKGIQFLALEYIIFLGLAIYGAINWHKRNKR